MAKKTVKGELEGLTAEQLKYDRAFKTVFRYKGIVAMILKYCIVELKNYSHEEIMRFIIDDKPVVYNTREELFESEMDLRDTENGHDNEAFIKFDLKFNIRIPGEKENAQVIISIDLEMQKGSTTYSLIARSLYYAASMLRDTMKKKDDYASINKVYSIWICDTNVVNRARHGEDDEKKEKRKEDISANKSWFHRYTMLRTYYNDEVHDDISKALNHSGIYKYDEEADLISIVIIELRKMSDKQNKELNEILDAIFNSDKTKTFETIEKYSKVNLTKISKVKGGIENMLTQQEREDICFNDGEKQGRAEGLQQGLQQGKEEELTKNIKSCFQKGLKLCKGNKTNAIAFVADMLEVSKEKVIKTLETK